MNKYGGGDATPSVGVYVVAGGRLELNGHSVSGMQIVWSDAPGFRGAPRADQGSR